MSPKARSGLFCLPSPVLLVPQGHTQVIGDIPPWVISKESICQQRQQSRPHTCPCAYQLRRVCPPFVRWRLCRKNFRPYLAANNVTWLQPKKNSGCFKTWLSRYQYRPVHDLQSIHSWVDIIIYSIFWPYSDSLIGFSLRKPWQLCWPSETRLWIELDQ